MDWFRERSFEAITVVKYVDPYLGFKKKNHYF